MTGIGETIEVGRARATGRVELHPGDGRTLKAVVYRPTPDDTNWPTATNLSDPTLKTTPQPGSGPGRVLVKELTYGARDPKRLTPNLCSQHRLLAWVHAATETEMDGPGTLLKNPPRLI